jgi:ferredoxin
MTRSDPRLWVDFIACDGRGLCAEVLPELVELDDWGFPILREDTVAPELLDQAAEAVRLCPLLALRLDPPIPLTVLGCATSARAG